MKYVKVNGDLIKKARSGEFDVIAHGCNCFCDMNNGISIFMSKYFKCNTYRLEQLKYKGDINKLGSIDFESFWLNKPRKFLDVINAYTQYEYGDNGTYVDYDALRLSMRKINKLFIGKHIGLPRIGCGGGGGEWSIVDNIYKEELTDVDVTVVMYAPDNYKRTLMI